MYALVEKNVSERSETMRLRVLNVLSGIIQTHQLAPTGDSLVDADATVQAYRIMKQSPGESTNKYPIKMEDKVKIIERLELKAPTQQQHAKSTHRGPRLKKRAQIDPCHKQSVCKR